MSYDLLSSLASAVLDGTVFEIVQSLQEVQQLEEKSLFSQRTKLVNEHKGKNILLSSFNSDEYSLFIYD